MRIAIYQPRASYYVGGGEIVPLEHARHLSMRGHDVTLVTTKAPFITQSDCFVRFCAENTKVKVQYIDVPDGLKRIYDVEPGINWRRWDEESLQVGVLAREHLLNGDYDIIALHNVVDSIAVPPAHKSVLHLHGYPSKINYLHEISIEVPTTLIAVSDFIAEKWETLLGVKNISVSVNGVDCERFVPTMDVKKEYDVLFVGRLVPIKGVRYLLEAVAKLVPEHPLRVGIAGSGPDGDELTRFVSEHNIEGDVEFLGHVSDQGLVGLYNSSKIVTLPSYDREGILTTMLEASACGVPVITTTACSMSEFIEDNVNGILVEPKSSDSVASAIVRLMDDEAAHKRISEGALKSAISWDWRNRIKNVEDIYERTILKH